ncbi:MAG: glutathione S-transferase family protein [Myxococcales bacterium]|nr:glutathione S-transferase family protein [Myxococcales bacterium]
MTQLRLCVLSLRYSSWSMRPWLALRHANADVTVETAEVDLSKRNPNDPSDATREKSGETLASRRKLGSVTGLFPVLHVGDTAIHESLAICEWVNDAYPDARLWPEDALARARARAISCEMLSSFSNIRTHLSCHLFGRTTALKLDAATNTELTRVFELWQDALERSGGPYLFGRFSIADCMYYPMRTRLRSYSVEVPQSLEPYLRAVDETPTVRALVEAARTAPRIPAYDEYLRSVGGDPDAALRA